MIDLTTRFKRYNSYRQNLIISPEIFEKQPQSRIKEELLQIIWNEQYLNTPLKTSDNSAILVQNPGTWNREAGPDFLNASLKIVTPNQESAELSGHIEIHTSPEMWFTHGHHNDPRYNHVVLHVVWEKTQQISPEIPIIELKSQLDRPLPQLLDTLPLQNNPTSRKYPTTDTAFTLLDKSDDEIRLLFESIALTRLNNKVKTQQQRLTMYNSNQALYLSTAEALGYKYNKEQFLLLANEITLERLNREKQLSGKLALLLGASGFLIDPTTSKVSEKHCDLLKKMWPIWFMHQPEELIQINWDFRGRPQNHPFRRVLALALIIDRLSVKPADFYLNLINSLSITDDLLKALQNSFETIDDKHWRGTLNFCKEFKTSSRLLGQTRQDEIIANIIIPFFIAYYRNNKKKQDFLAKSFIKMPALKSNTLLKEGTYRFLLPPSRARKILTTNGSQQGLIQLLNDFNTFGHQKVMDMLERLF